MFASSKTLMTAGRSNTPPWIYIFKQILLTLLKSVLERGLRGCEGGTEGRVTYGKIHQRNNPTTSPPHGQGYSLLSQQDASGFRYFGQLSVLKSQALPLGMNLIISCRRIVFFPSDQWPANLLKQDQAHI